MANGGKKGPRNNDGRRRAQRVKTSRFGSESAPGPIPDQAPESAPEAELTTIAPTRTEPAAVALGPATTDVSVVPMNSEPVSAEPRARSGPQIRVKVYSGVSVVRSSDNKSIPDDGAPASISVSRWLSHPPLEPKPIRKVTPKHLEPRSERPLALWVTGAAALAAGWIMLSSPRSEPATQALPGPQPSVLTTPAQRTPTVTTSAPEIQRAPPSSAARTRPVEPAPVVTPARVLAAVAAPPGPLVAEDVEVTPVPNAEAPAPSENETRSKVSAAPVRAARPSEAVRRDRSSESPARRPAPVDVARYDDVLPRAAIRGEASAAVARNYDDVLPMAARLVTNNSSPVVRDVDDAPSDRERAERYDHVPPRAATEAPTPED